MALIPRQAWLIVWKRTGRAVDAHGGLMAYTSKAEGEKDLDADTQRLVRVYVQAMEDRHSFRCRSCRTRPVAIPNARCLPCQQLWTA